MKRGILMECLVKIYNNEQLSNLISVLSFKPKKVIFIYDDNINDVNALSSIEYACVEKVEGINLEFVNVNSQSLDDVSKKCKKIIHRNRSCYFDITGSEELVAIGAYLACAKNFVPIFKMDIKRRKLINIYGCNFLSEKFSMPKMSINTLLMSHGANIEGYFHPTPNENLFEPILEFSDIVFNNITSWKELCVYIQTGAKAQFVEAKPLDFNSPLNIPNTKAHLTYNAQKLLHSAQKLGFIYNLKIDSENCRFKFKDLPIKKYLTDFGSWLELYVFIKLKQSNIFDDVRLSVKLNWDRVKKSTSEVVNEIDVTFFNGIHPVFVSCKLSDPSTEALQELSMYPNYFGGCYSKCIMVTLGNFKAERNSVYNRAIQMGIGVIDASDIKKDRFIETIKTILKIKEK